MDHIYTLSLDLGTVKVNETRIAFSRLYPVIVKTFPCLSAENHIQFSNVVFF